MSLTAEIAPAPGFAGALESATTVPLGMSGVTGAVWDVAAASFDDVVQEQLFGFATARWPATSPEPWLFTLRGEVVGGVLVMIQRLPLGVSAIALAKWGPLLKDNRRPDAAHIRAAMVDALIAEYAERRGMLLSLMPRAETGSAVGHSAALLARGFKAGIGLNFPDRYLVRADIDASEQRKSLGQKWRYHLNKAEKANLTFEIATPDGLAEFDALYRAMTDRKRFTDYSAYECLPRQMADPVEALRPKLFFVRESGQAVAGAAIFVAGDTAVYLYGATNDRALPLRAGYFLHWHILHWLRENTSARWYDLGGSDGFQGLHQFKKGLVGSAGAIVPVPAVANYAARRLPFLIGNAAFRARDAKQQAERWLDAHWPGRSHPDQKAEAS